MLGKGCSLKVYSSRHNGWFGWHTYFHPPVVQLGISLVHCQSKDMVQYHTYKSVSLLGGSQRFYQEIGGIVVCARSSLGRQILTLMIHRDSSARDVKHSPQAWHASPRLWSRHQMCTVQMDGSVYIPTSIPSVVQPGKT